MTWPGPVHRGGADVGHHDPGAVGEQVLDQVGADLADALDRDPAPGQARRAPGVLGGGPHALEDAEGGQHRAVAGPRRLRRTGP
jgi:hypothetical protein